MNNQFNNRIDNISLIQNISYIVASIKVISIFMKYSQVLLDKHIAPGAFLPVACARKTTCSNFYFSYLWIVTQIWLDAALCSTDLLEQHYKTCIIYTQTERERQRQRERTHTRTRARTHTHTHTCTYTHKIIQERSNQVLDSQT